MSRSPISHRVYVRGIPCCFGLDFCRANLKAQCRLIGPTRRWVHGPCTVPTAAPAASYKCRPGHAIRPARWVQTNMPPRPRATPCGPHANDSGRPGRGRRGGAGPGAAASRIRVLGGRLAAPGGCGTGSGGARPRDVRGGGRRRRGWPRAAVLAGGQSGVPWHRATTAGQPAGAEPPARVALVHGGE
jgi:hypothetical protein